MKKKRRFRFETRDQPLLSRPQFVKRLAGGFGVAFLVIGVSLLVGMAGYHWFENLPWIDAFLNAAMILGGEGPLAQPQSWNGKLFAGCYALYSGLIVIVAAGILFAPVFHRLLHSFHVESEGDE